MQSVPIDYDSVASLYDLYVDVDYDVPFFLSEVARVCGPMLELTAGTGRLSLPLIEAGVDLTCVDFSQGMLDVLSHKLSARGLKAELVCGDACTLSLTRRFELAILPFQSFMEFIGEASQYAVLRSAFDALLPGGRFICTMHNPPVRRRQVDGTQRLVGQFQMDGGTLLVSGFEQGGQPVVSRLQSFEFFGPDGRMIWKRLMPMRFEFIEREAFERMANAVGFRVIDLFGDYRRTPFDPVESPVMIWVLEKR
ncbi:MAG: class I SAM-dependent methyltransferase [Chromatiales bacterium]|nr:class I SAM-dependent methyltransferase [Chromatiales bacterium]